MYNYNETQIKRIKYLLRRLASLKNGHTLSAQFSEGYPFYSHIDRFGNTTKSSEELSNDEIFKYLQENKDVESKIDLIEIAWQYFFTYGTPNGDLFKHNNMFETIKKGGGLTLIHVTNHYKDICKSGLLYPSGGCLGASLYCVPLRSDGRVHNLGKFVHEYELPEVMARKNMSKGQLDVIAITVDSENFIHSNAETNALDYLLMGQLQFEIYEYFKKESKLDSSIFDELEEGVIEQVRQTQDFLSICLDYHMDYISDSYFIRLFEDALVKMPFLGYVYFEVLVEYITLFQNDNATLVLKELGEINNYNYKRMVFDLSPDLLDGFKLINFRPSVNSVISYLKEKSEKGIIFTNFLEDHFINFLKWRVAQYIRYKLLDKTPLDLSGSKEDLFDKHHSLLGHLVHREIRINKKLKEYSNIYDEKRAETIWQVWNTENVLYPYNSIVPKGEVGINPKYNNLEYGVYRAEIDKEGYVKFKNKLEAKLSFELIKGTSNLRAP